MPVHLQVALGDKRGVGVGRPEAAAPGSRPTVKIGRDPAVFGVSGVAPRLMAVRESGGRPSRGQQYLAFLTLPTAVGAVIRALTP